MAQADNALFLFENFVDADFGASVTASTTAGALGPANVQDPRLGKVWRAAGSSGYLLVDFGRSRDISTVIVWGHNLTTAGTMRARLDDDSGMVSPAYDSGTIDAWPSITGAGEGGAGEGGAGGFPLLEGYKGYRYYRVLQLGAVYSGRYLRIDVDDATLANVEVARLGAGLGFQPQINAAMGWDWEWVDPSEIETTDCGGMRVIRRPKYRVLRLSFDMQSEGEAMSSWDDLKRQVGRSRDLFCVLFPTAADPLMWRTAIYGIPTDQGAISNPHFRLYETSITIREIVG